jgi:hypothetical protein
MKNRSKLILTSLAFVFAIATFAPASALTMAECSAKYKEAQKAGTLKGMKWNDFRKAECGASTKPASTTATTSTKAKTATPTASKPTNAVFPSRVDPKYEKETLGKARMKTCVDQYNANKATNANGGLKWIVEGGGYWSECNKRLKG